MKRTVFVALTGLILAGAIIGLSACKDISEQKTDSAVRSSSTNNIQADSTKSPSASNVENASSQSKSACSACMSSSMKSGMVSKSQTASSDSCGCENVSSTVQTKAKSQSEEKVVQQKQSGSSSCPVLVHKTITIGGMMCDDCVEHIKEALENVRGVKVESVEIGKAVVEICGTVSNDTLKYAIEKSSNGSASGYTVKNIS